MATTMRLALVIGTFLALVLFAASYAVGFREKAQIQQSDRWLEHEFGGPPLADPGRFHMTPPVVLAAQAAEDRGIVLLVAGFVVGSLVAGVLVYALLRMVLDRFVSARWSCLSAALLCGASLVFASGFVLGLWEISRLPKVSA